MSINIVEKQIQDFLSEVSPAVMAIRGEWGVGKTYAWNKYIKKAKDGGRIGLDGYSYVSLFGVNSLDSLKYSIFESVVEKGVIGEGASIDSFKKNAFGLTKKLGRKSLGFLKKSPLLDGFGSVIESVSFLSLSKTIVCLDDLERRGDGLCMKDVMGLVSQLKEQKGCKIVLLMNEKEEGMDDYKKFMEKVVDIDLEFSPTAEECARIAYGPNVEMGSVLGGFSEKLNIRNIRVLKKIERLANAASVYLKGKDKEIVHGFMHSLVLFSWCHYLHGDDVPDLDYVIDRDFNSWGLGVKDENDQEKRWRSRLNDYGYSSTDELDVVIAEAVKFGYFPEDSIRVQLEAAIARLNDARASVAFQQAWNLYHGSFGDDKDDLVHALESGLKENVKNVSPLNLNGTVTLLRELGETNLASGIIDFYIDARKSEKDIFDLSRGVFFRDDPDEEIVRKFNLILGGFKEDENARTVLSRISGRNGWGPDDEEVLENTSVEEFYDIFKSLRGDGLSDYVNACLRFGSFSNATERQKKIANQAKAALKKIAGENDLNRIRVRKFGVDV